MTSWGPALPCLRHELQKRGHSPVLVCLRDQIVGRVTHMCVNNSHLHWHTVMVCSDQNYLDLRGCYCHFILGSRIRKRSKHGDWSRSWFLSLLAPTQSPRPGRLAFPPVSILFSISAHHASGVASSESRASLLHRRPGISRQLLGTGWKF